MYTVNTMFFYEVAPASRQYHGATLLTYSSAQKLQIGQIIVVKIRSIVTTAFIVTQVEKPEFKTTEITEVLPTILPKTHVELFKWLRLYYPAPTGLIAQQFLPLAASKDYVLPNPTESPSNKKEVILAPPLTPEQKTAVAISSNPANRTTLLHGTTGSGKTRVYIERAQQTLAAGRSVLVLVPEIALSPQIVKTFESHFDAPIHVTHSNLTPAKRRTVWQAILSETQPQIVIGPRSALFTPLNNVGLIVVDEFHESAYKQDQAPYYQSIRVASQLSNLHKAQLLLGSATPPVSEYYIAEQKQIPIVRMEKKALDSDNPSQITTHVVSLKDSAEKTKYPLISQTLLNQIKQTLNKHEQVLLFLNKRGSARLLLCQSCGWHALCERCDLPLTFHGDTHRLQCHTCGYSRSAPSVCPECASHDIIFKSPGTKAIVEAVQHAFPDAIVGRFDKDNRKAERLETRHADIVSGKIDILVGTQLLAKGHDLPRLGLVGILLAENELQFPDYTSSERSYQLMHQLIGRVGRGHRAGSVVVQTYDPVNPAVQTAIQKHTWADFYQTQLTEREQFEFPPFFHLMKIEVTRARQATVLSSCDQIIDFIRASGEPVKISGPAPSFIEKRNNTWTWQIIVKTRQRTALTRLANTIPVKCTVNLDPSNLL